ncbi:4-alpha-glucanotransferase [uncultured Desulfobacterium sp.]|uniref:4-alpha-glucanotransferase n=1 Tax=uncultured Desulfobacterium sp. TaxID=201089 RepID=A0A445N2I9_9BACT|nr:4-alpha-glucanotransferase [uncultured Desulfobacterium sp.]
MKTRSSGILLHLSSLPSPFGIGDMGPWAYRFVDFLARAGQRYWQILPLNPTETTYQNSPYHSTSAFASNPLFISPELMVEGGLLTNDDIKPFKTNSKGAVEYGDVSRRKKIVFLKAYKHFKNGVARDGFDEFCTRNAFWLDDFSLFSSIRSHLRKRPWNQWDKGLRHMIPRDLTAVKKRLRESIDLAMFLQYEFYKQWSALKSYCNDKKIFVIGDMPFYVPYNSTDLWACRRYFKLNKDLRPSVVSGVPPDYFSRTGQLWGNPIYKWDVMKKDGYGWWIKRVTHNLSLFDFLRIDHFRGIASYWEVPAGEKNAVNGKWVKGPGEDLFRAIYRKIPDPPIIAEDLGFITPDVTRLVNQFKIPGMKVLQFGFDEPSSIYAPHNIGKNYVVYTGTHDNNTTRGWFENEATLQAKKRLFRYIGRRIRANEAAHELIRLAMMSRAATAIIPMQDILNLGQAARMNLPATRKGNWRWRLKPEGISPGVADRLLELTETFGRA